jgi:PAS domain S-box-containing protein
MSKILLVDDNQSARVTLSIALKSEGFKVEAVDSGEEALRRLESGPYDWVVSDVNMPELDGIELARRIRQSDVQTNILLISAFRCNDELKGISINGFLEKPIDVHKLYQILREQKTPKEDMTDSPINRVTHGLWLEKKGGNGESEVIRFKDKTEKEHFEKRTFDFYELLEKKVEERTRELVEKQQKLEEAYFELRKTKGYLEHLLDASPNCVISMNKEKQILSFNTGAEETFGYSRGNIIGKDAAMLHPPEEQQRMGEIFERTLVHGTWSGEVTGIRKEGEVFPMSVVTTKVLDETGSVIALLEMSRDITQEKKMEQQLLYAEKLSVLGQLAPRVAHEINNPLHVISANAQFGLMVLEDREKVKSCLEKAFHETERIERLTQQLMDVARPMEMQIREISIQDLLENALLFLEDVGEIKQLEVKKDYGSALPVVYGDQAQLEQVFRNLILNASQAMESRQTRILTVAVRSMADQKHVEVSIGDTGCGIEEQNLEQVFEPFFTTKSRGKGNGLGMPIVKSIVERHNGWIGVESKAGEGTRMLVYLPADASLAPVELK